MTRLDTEPAGFDADESRLRIEEARERTDRVGTTAHTRDNHVRIAAVENLAALPPRFVADDALKLTHHPWERMRAHRGAEAVVRVLDARDPRAHRLVDRVLQGCAPRLHRNDLGA